MWNMWRKCFGFRWESYTFFSEKFPCLREERKNKSIIVAVYRKLFRKPFYDQYNYTNVPMRVGYITGADMMIRSSLFEKVGKFDADIFMYSGGS